MSDGKKIEIRIAATGGEQAAAEVRKVESASASLDRALGIVVQSEEELAAKRAQFLTAAEAEVAEVDRMVEASKRLKAALPQVPFSQTGNVIEEMAKGPLPKGTAGVKNLGMTFTQVGYQVTDFTTQVSMGTSAFTAFAQQAPQAIAALTQFGAAGASFSAVMSASVGVMMPLSLIVTELAIGIPMVVRAWDDMKAAQDAATASAEAAAEMEAKLNEVLAFGADAYFGAAEAAAKLVEITDESTRAINAEKAAIDSRNAVLDADAAAYKARRDREDAAKIRNGADPETVKIERASSDEAEALRRIDRELDAKRAGLKDAKNAAVNADAQVGITKVAPDSTPELVAEAQKKADELRQRAEKMQRDLEQAERIAQSKRTEVRERAAGEIEGLAYSRTQRKEAEAKREADKKAAQDKRDAAKETREERSSLGDRLEGAEESLDASARRSGLNVRKRGLATGNDTLKTVGKALSDGTDAAELQKLGDMVREASAKNGQAMTSALLQLLTQLNQQAQQIETIKKQIRNK